MSNYLPIFRVPGGAHYMPDPFGPSGIKQGVTMSLGRELRPPIALPINPASWTQPWWMVTTIVCSHMTGADSGWQVVYDPAAPSGYYMKSYSSRRAELLRGYHEAVAKDSFDWAGPRLDN